MTRAGSDLRSYGLAGVLPAWPDNPPASVSSEQRAALDDELADLEELLGRLTASSPPEVQAAVRALADLHERRDRAADAQLRERLDVLGRVQKALSHLRRMPSAEAIIAAAPRQACEACGFDRAVLYRLRGNQMLAESLWVNGDPATSVRLLEFSRDHPAELTAGILESEMIRGRKPMAIQDAIGDPRVLATLVEAYDSHSYVAAPIMPEGRVIGFLHADHRLKPRRVDEFDRDSLWAFAEGFGHVVERAQLADRLRAQGDELRKLLQRTDAVVAEYLDAEVELVSVDSAGAGATSATAAILPPVDSATPGQLSKRELEVLALLGTGASNAHIAARLVIAEDTAKSHVKRILRKLGAANRVEAATIWLRAQQP
ncbi:LuxR C-terminal-related transcriptional regulator [Mycobacterium sp. M26]|uniref:LuxR C-terminal-related transcriptional regulator n=1 Tax=Mycobacterium sp. M26 TaxID=1762962 RepID=UPI00073FA543|nr:LuxR C-terminal-related transcriptional regulator [Mycobacterium sp. M26]